MTLKVFFDTNVLIDVLAERQPFYEDSAELWSLSERKRIAGLVSAITFTNIFYIVRRLTDLKTARRSLTLLQSSFATVACDARIINQAMTSRFTSFEDAVQYYSAIEAAADCLVSRNVSHFPKLDDCTVLTPAEFLAAHSFEQPQ